MICIQISQKEYAPHKIGSIKAEDMQNDTQFLESFFTHKTWVLGCEGGEELVLECLYELIERYIYSSKIELKN